jgi:hypothetical protein
VAASKSKSLDSEEIRLLRSLQKRCHDTGKSAQDNADAGVVISIFYE